MIDRYRYPLINAPIKSANLRKRRVLPCALDNILNMCSCLVHMTYLDSF